MKYKLHIFGILIDGPNNVFYDNEYVHMNYTFYESQLNNNHQSIFFHRLRKCVAACISIKKIDTNYNLTDILTKSLSEANCIAPRSRIIYSNILNNRYFFPNGHCILISDLAGNLYGQLDCILYGR